MVRRLSSRSSPLTKWHKVSIKGLEGGESDHAHLYAISAVPRREPDPWHEHSHSITLPEVHSAVFIQAARDDTADLQT